MEVGIDVLVDNPFRGAIELEILPVSDPGHQLDSQSAWAAENLAVLRHLLHTKRLLGSRMQGKRLKAARCTQYRGPDRELNKM